MHRLSHFGMASLSYFSAIVLMHQFTIMEEDMLAYSDIQVFFVSILILIHVLVGCYNAYHTCCFEDNDYDCKEIEG
jgi:hypothetical protein